MEFRSKIDNYFMVIISITLLVICAAFLLPLFLDSERTIVQIVITLSLCILTIGFILWSSFSIKYVFYQDHLFVKAGLIRSRIPYEEITKISPTTEILTGYRLLSSKNALEIFYKSGYLGSVKITPKDRELFISEIKNRCQNVQVS